MRLANSLETRNSVQELQQALARKSKLNPRLRFYSLYDKVYRMDVLIEAWKKVRSNKGSSGVDKIALKDIETSGVELFLSTLQEELKLHYYKPQPLRRVYIPKANGKKRPLSIPTIKDRVVQQAVKLVIEPIFEVHFSSYSYGYRPQKGAQAAVKEVRKFLNWGLIHVVEADIEDRFGTIPHKELMERIAARISDGGILKIIRSWLKCGVMVREQVRTPITGTPQGGVISPLLANVYLDGLDRIWKEQRMDGNYCNSHLIRYADDLVILTNRNPKVAEYVLRRIVTDLGLKVNETKTKTLNAQKEPFDFLGFSLRQQLNPKTGRWFALTIPSHQAQIQVQKTIRKLTSRGVQKKVSEVINEINPVLRGWVNYFRIGHSARVFSEVRRFTLCRVRRYMRRKQGGRGYGWKKLSSNFFYGTLGLFYEYRIVRGD